MEEVIMPNWFYNELVITGEKQELQRFKIAALGRYPWATDAGVLCFNSLVPIPPPVLESSYNDWTRANWGCKFGGNAARLEKETESELFTGSRLRTVLPRNFFGV